MDYFKPVDNFKLAKWVLCKTKWVAPLCYPYLPPSKPMLDSVVIMTRVVSVVTLARFQCRYIVRFGVAK